jgi:hypothetical protein
MPAMESHFRTVLHSPPHRDLPAGKISRIVRLIFEQTEENLSCGKNKSKFPDLLFKLEFEKRTFIFVF